MLLLAFFLYPVFAIAKLFVIRSGVDVDRCSGKIEGCQHRFAGQE